MESSNSLCSKEIIMTAEKNLKANSLQYTDEFNNYDSLKYIYISNERLRKLAIIKMLKKLINMKLYEKKFQRK